MKEIGVKTLCRVDSNHPDKTSNVWHLVCLNAITEKDTNSHIGYGEDYDMLSRRMEHFLGLHYEEESIENGMLRLSAITYPLTKSNVEKTNQKMLKLSEQRSQLNERWKNAMTVLDKVELKFLI